MSLIQCWVANWMVNVAFSWTLTSLCKFLYTGCANPLGLENRKIKNSQLSSYSHFDDWEPFRARLNNAKAWCSDSNDHLHEYLQIDLLTVRHVSAITTQGVNTGFPLYLSYYVKTYMIKYSYDGRTWFFYEDTNGADMVSNNWSCLLFTTTCVQCFA